MIDLAIETRSVIYPKTLEKAMLAIERLTSNKMEHMNFIETQLYAFMAPRFTPYYPRFDHWFRNKVIPGFCCGERIIYVVLDYQEIVGVSILKLSKKVQSNNKICSFYITQDNRGGGVGEGLMTESLRELYASRRPVIITVPEERSIDKIGELNFIIFLHSFGFKQIAEIQGRYRPDKKEYVLALSTGPDYN